MLQYFKFLISRKLNNMFFEKNRYCSKVNTQIDMIISIKKGEKNGVWNFSFECRNRILADVFHTKFQEQKKRKPVAFFSELKRKKCTYMKSNRDCERSSIISSMKSLWSIARNVSDMLLESPKFQVSEKHPPSWNVINQNGQENFEKKKRRKIDTSV